MYELVNTSLPNGLLPGTHGFATVAMTRGTPDQVRLALESLSSYRHRHGEHDARYATENPVAWSHLVLRDGSHAVSCVRASEFDYTGRTNRLARHWCLARGEFPDSVNPADFLAANVELLSASWKGDARWLEPRGDSPVGSLLPRSDLRPVAWISLYGEDRGATLAARFASLLRSEIEGNNRPIAFRTSQTWDRDGTKLLRLFADLISLLPPELRAKATFSTYPAALPSHFVCHLRGLQSDSPDFAALTAGRPWFDCAAGTAGNEDKLPHDPTLEKLARHGRDVQDVPPAAENGKSQSASDPTATDEGDGRSASDADRAPPPARHASGPSRGGIPCPFPENSLLPPPKRDNATLYAVVGGVAVAMAMVAAIFLLKGARGPTPPQPEPAETGETVSTNGLQVESSSESPHAEEVPSDEAVTKPEEQPVLRAEDKTASENPAPKDGETLPKTPESAKGPEWEFVQATILSDKRPPKPNDVGKATWFYYDDTGKLKSDDATPQKTPVGPQWKDDPAKRVDVDMDLLYLHKKKELCFEFRVDLKKPFADTNKNELSLKEVCFGADPAVFDTWCRLNGRTVRYKIEYSASENKGSLGWMETSDDPLKLDAFVAEINKAEREKLETTMNEAEKRVKDLKSGMNEVEKKLNSASNLCARVCKNCGEKDKDKKTKEAEKIGEDYKKEIPDKFSKEPDPTNVNDWNHLVTFFEKQLRRSKAKFEDAQKAFACAKSEWDAFNEKKTEREASARQWYFKVKPVPVEAAEGQSK